MLDTDEPFGLVRVKTEAKAIEAACASRKNAVWPRLWPHIVGKIKSGDTLYGKEEIWLHDYLVALGRFELVPGNVQTVQVPRDWAAKVLGGRDASAERAIRQLREIGLIDLVHKGEKGHASLYAVLPLPDPKEPELDSIPPPPQIES